MPAFPALDEEPPPIDRRRILRRAGAGIVVLVVLAGLGAGGRAVYGAVHGGSSHKVTGSVLAMTTALSLVSVRPDGTDPLPYKDYTYIGGGTGGASVAPDGSELVTGTGDLVTLRDGKPVRHSTALYGPLASSGSPDTGILTLTPFADHGRDVVFSGEVQLDGTSRLAIASVQGTGRRDLGVVDAYAGDPLTAGAFDAVPLTTSDQPGPAVADTAIEHRSVGAAPTTIVTAARIAADLHVPDPADLSLAVTPDPTGQRLAVEARSVAHDTSLGLAVYTRAGRPVGHVATALSGAVSWSPSGRQLLFSAGGRLRVWTPGGPGPASIALPPRAQLLGSCAWSPGERAVACVGYPGVGSEPDAWVEVDLRAKRVTVTPAAGYPLVWTG